MRAIMVFATVGLFLLPCVAMADGCDGVFGVSVDYGDRGDEGEAFGGSLRFLAPLGCGSVLLTGSLSDGLSVYEVENHGAASSRTLYLRRDDTDIWAATANFIRTVAREGQHSEVYYGGGPGWYKVHGSDTERDSFGAQVLVGFTHESDWFAELRYVFGTEFDWGGGTSDVDGVCFSIGRWLK